MAESIPDSFSRSEALVDAAIAGIDLVAPAFPELPPFRRKRELDIALLTAAASRMGLSITSLGPECVRLERSGRVLVFHQNMSSTLQAVDRLATNNKLLTKAILQSSGLPVAKGEVVTSTAGALDAYRRIGGAVVIKPLAGSGGRGVTVGIQSEQHVEPAARTAFSMSRRILVEECIESVDLRVMVVGGRAIAVQMRVPANVIGDGASTIRELVDAKNQARLRNAYLRGALIKLDDPLLAQLAWRGLSVADVPAAGQRVYLHFKANLSSGGDSVALERVVHPSLLRLAEQALAPFTSAYHAGVDILVERIDLPPEEQRCVICEINCNNEHPIHLYPSFGDRVDAPGLMLERYFSPHFDAFSEALASERPWRRLERMPGFASALTKWQRTTILAGAGEPAVPARWRCAAGPRVSGLQVDDLARATPEIEFRARSKFLLEISVRKEARIVEPTGRSVVGSVLASRSGHLCRLLDAEDIPHCQTYRLKRGAFTRAVAALQATGPWLVAQEGPNGDGWAPVRTAAGLRRVWRRAPKGQSIAVRETGLDFRMRLLMLEGRMIACVAVVAAGVVGDGRSSVAELIEEQERIKQAHPLQKLVRAKASIWRPERLARLGIDPQGIPESGSRVKLGRLPFIEWAGDVIGLAGCPVPGLPDQAAWILGVLGRPRLAAIEFVPRPKSGTPGGRQWTFAAYDPMPCLVEFEQPFRGASTPVHGELARYLAMLDGYPTGAEGSRPGGGVSASTLRPSAVDDSNRRP